MDAQSMKRHSNEMQLIRLEGLPRTSIKTSLASAFRSDTMNLELSSFFDFS
jgi:hypothetical protein